MMVDQVDSAAGEKTGFANPKSNIVRQSRRRQPAK